MAVAIVGVALKIFLVVFLGAGVLRGVECFDLRGDGLLDGLLNPVFHRLCGKVLRRVVGENGTAVLCADVVALAIERGWVVQDEEYLQQGFVADDLRVK